MLPALHDDAIVLTGYTDQDGPAPLAGEAGPTRTFAARDQVTGRLLGGCELRIQPRGSARVRYWTFTAERGRGYATRGLVLLLRYARAIGLRQAEAHIAADNHAARRVAEKAGFLSAAAFTAADGTGMIQYLVSLATWS